MVQEVEAYDLQVVLSGTDHTLGQQVGEDNFEGDTVDDRSVDLVEKDGEDKLEVDHLELVERMFVLWQDGTEVVVHMYLVVEVVAALQVLVGVLLVVENLLVQD